MATQSPANVETKKKKKKKGKVKWSNLYTFSCLRPPPPVNRSDFGQPGYSRVVFCNDSGMHKMKPYKYPTNDVSTTKYNVVTFLPKSLFEQFRRVANLYFLLVAVLSVTSLAPFSPLSLIAPLVFVVGISMLKEGVEDWHRFLQDLEVNSRKVKVHIGNGMFVDRSWKVLRVGDVVKVSKNEYFPCDLLLLSSSYEDGVCYVETMNLDGETNLKIKRCLECTLGFDEELKFDKFKATIRCEDPNSSLYTFVANLEFGDEDQLDCSYPLSPSQLLLRDSKLQNTDYVYGVVIFTGRDTKVVRNSMKSPSKRSRVERKMDHVIYVLFFMLLLISVITSIGSARYTDQPQTAKEWWYLQLLDDTDGSFDPDKPLISGFLQFLRALILYGYLIPISLYVSIEVVKFLQAMLINNDLQLFDEMSGKSVESRTSNLNEELGQVEMILSDKTGTLTCNQMEFRKCSIEGITYGGDVNEIVRAASQRMNIDIESYRFNLDGADSTPRDSIEMVEISSDQNKIDLNTEKGIQNLGVTAIKGFNFIDDRLMNKRWLHGSNVWDMIMFFRVMALCHTGIPVENCEGTTSHKLKYEAESPEEVTFLIAAQEFGFQFCRRTQSSMFVKEIDPSGLERMSVIVRDEVGQIFLVCKGADNIIFDRLGDGGRTYQHATTIHLANYAEDGLRTMVFAYRKIEDSEYEKWSSTFTKAKATIGHEREELLENVSETIEKDLVLLDKLAQAGLRIWLLTGDKEETAVNIGFACSLLRHDMKQFHLSLSRDAESKNQLKAMKDDILNQIEASYQVTANEKTKDDPFALVVDGKALEIALTNDIRDRFLQLAVNCASVICCRVSPKQKALAVMASDFSMPQFRFLERLLIVHGHWCYKRISKMILYFVYKNIVFGLTLFYYELYSKFSGDVLYDGCWKRIIGWMVNGILTSLAIFILNVYILSFSAFRQGGEVVDIAHLGVTTYTAVVWTVNCQIALIITHFTWIQHFFIWGSILCWYIFLLFYGALPPKYSNREFRLLVEAVGPAPVYWIVVLLVVVVSLLPYFIYMVIQRLFYPMDDHVIQEMKYGRKIVADDETWLREKQSSRKATHIGFSARAVMASDFSMPQFRFLERLLIVHGHWCYKRISKMILYFVYTNIVFGLTLFYYELYSKFSGDVLYDGCWKRIIGWMGNGILTSLAIFILNVYILSFSVFRQGGEVVDIAHLGVTTYTAVVWTVNCQIALIITHFTWIQHFFIWESILCWYIFLLFYGALPPKYSNREFRLLVEAVGPAPVYWIVVLLVVVISLLSYFIYMVIQRSFYPMDDHVIQEMKYRGKTVVDDEMWLREKQSSRKATHIGFSARVDAKILHLKDQLHKKRMFVIKSFTNSPIRRSISSSS
ncbi:HAD-like domain-containing protein [Cynara cardunculus var. scolymus]|uniref:Phospholipid-transporting ATPase n=1 Tax=Cynara cardunculus var. scolymus TaxID=59895 RepID=A0A103XQL8_CYNCS|nr:HAD-like domain-containing protein [Cynara cardunculus var. scolymus]